MNQSGRGVMMRALIQLTGGIAVLLLGSLLLVWLMPETARLYRRMGVPEPVLEAITGEGVEARKPEGRQHQNGEAGVRDKFRSSPPLVVVKKAGEGRTNDRLKAIGDGEALRSVVVTAPASGQITGFLVKSGDRVAEGQPIARLDDRAEKLAVERAKVTLAAARSVLARNQDLKSIVSGADIEDATNAVRMAEIAPATAGLDLARRTVLSPLAGVAGIPAAGAGDYVTGTTPLVTIDDRSSLIVDFQVPERFSPLLSTGDSLVAQAIARQGTTYSGKIIAIDNRIEAASRTLRVQAAIPNEGDHLRPGQAFEVRISLAGDIWPSVDPLAIQRDSQGAFVWKVTGGKVHRVGLAIIERNPDSVLVKAGILPGDDIVIEGVQKLREGEEISLSNPEAGQ